MNRKVLSLPAVIACLMLVAGCMLFWLAENRYSQKAFCVNIYQGDTLLKTLPLSQDAVFEIESIGMKIEVLQGKAFISESSCRCKTCQSFGKLSKAGQTAICLPAKIRLELDGDSGLDAML